jgi:hypothetical protein
MGDGLDGGDGRGQGAGVTLAAADTTATSMVVTRSPTGGAAMLKAFIDADQVAGNLG